MNKQFQVAQASGTGNSNNASPERIFTLTKPLADQSVVINVGYEQKVKVDFSGIAQEKITLVHIGEKLIILFDNQSTVTIEPFFDSRHDALGNLSIEVSPGRDLSVSEFASSFPITTDQSVLPAAGTEGNAQASGANFLPPLTDPLPPIPTNILAPPEEIPPPVFTPDTPQALPPNPTPPPPAPPAGPTIVAGIGQPLDVDESFIPAIGSLTVIPGTKNLPSDTEAFAGSFTVNAPAGVQSITYALSITGGNGVDTGLIDTVTGNHLFLFLEGGQIVAREGATAAQAAAGGPGSIDATLGVDATGHVTFTILRADHEFVVNPDGFKAISPSGGLVSLIATVTDNNNNTASASIDLGPLITIHDDIPHIAAIGAGAALSLSETNLTSTVLDDNIAGSAPNLALTSTTGNYSTAFIHLNGADGATIAYALSITGGNGTASGLVDSHTGLSDVLVLNGNTVEGHVGSVGGALAFTIAVDPATGIVTFTEDRAVSQAIASSPDTGEGISLTAGLLNLTATITDGDGDQATASLDLGKQLTITDDGPSIQVKVLGEEQHLPFLTLSETHLTATVLDDNIAGSAPSLALTSTTGDFSTAFTSTTGADNATIAYALSITGGNGTASGLVDSHTGSSDVLVLNGNTIEGHVGTTGGTLAFTITVDPATGIVTFTEDRAVVQADATSPDTGEGISLTAGIVNLTATITDNDGDFQTASLDLGKQLTITDDGPSISATGTGPALSLSETHLTSTVLDDHIAGSAPSLALTSTTGDFSGAFTSATGADNATIAYALSITGGNGTASGLVDSHTGSSDVLVLNGNTIEGHVGTTGGTLAFTITVDPATGIVTFTEDRAVVQADATSPDTGEGISLTAGLVNLVATITDKDGDFQTASLDLGKQLTITDDGPSISATGTGPALSLSETNLTSTVLDDHIAGSAPSLALTSTTGDFSGAFTSATGADNATIAYALSITGGNGTASGLVDSHTGSSDVLVLNGNTIEGHVGTIGGTLAFTITVDPATGIVTFTEDRAVVQADATSPDTGEGISLTAGLVNLVATITDKDGDFQTASLDLGKQLTITDDGPSISATGTGPALSLSETHLTSTVLDDNIAGSAPSLALTSTTGDFSGAFTSATGADNATIAYALSITGGNGTASGLVDSHTGSSDVLVLNGNTIEGHVGTTGGTLAFTITVDPATGIVTFTEDRAVVQADATSPDTGEGISLTAGLVNLVATITDKDGDFQTASLDLGKQLTITDDGPSISATGTGPALSLSETHLTSTVLDDNIAGSAPSLALTSTTGDFSGAFTSATGADNATIAYALSITGGNGTASGLVDSHTGSSDVLVLNGNTIEGHVGTTGGTLAFTITVDPATGIVTFTEDRAVVQADATSPDTGEGISLTAGLVNLVATITDKDGDFQTAHIDLGKQLTITDDGPSISATGTGPALSLSETHLTSTVLDDHIAGSAPSLALTSTTGDFSGAFTSATGADNATIAYALSITGGNGTASGLVDSHTGSSDVLVLNGNTIEGHVGTTGGTLAFTITVDPATGIVTFTEDRAVVQADATSPDTGEGISLTAGLVNLVATITDKDGDFQTASLDLGKQLTITDDGPSISATGTGPALSLSETHLTSTVLDDNIAGSAPSLALTSTTGDFSGAFTSATGADNATIAYALSITGGNGTASGLVDSHTGSSDVLVLNGNTIEGHVGTTGGTLAFTITVDPATGIVTFTEDRAVVQADATSPDTGEGISLTAGIVNLTATITDKDGDFQTAHIDLGKQLTITDDGPSISATGTGPALSLSETHLTSTVLDDHIAGSAPSLALTSTTGDFSGAFTSATGADNATIAYALSITGGNGTASGLVDSHTGSSDVLVLNGNTIEGHVGTTGGTLAFTITVDPATGIVTFTEDRAVVQADATSPDTGEGISLTAGIVNLTATITDKDGDFQTAHIDLGKQLTITDDGPSISATGTGPALSLSETHLTSTVLDDHIAGSAPSLALTSTTGDFSGAFTSATGADNATIAYALSITGGNGTASGLVDSHTGSSDVLVLNGNTIEGHVGTTGGTLAFTITVDPATGIVTFTEDRAVVQADATSPDTGEGISLTAGIVNLTATITDKDGDFQTAHIDLGKQLTITDDGPSISATGTGPALSLSETHLTSTVLDDHIAGSAPSLALTSTTGDFSGAFTSATGADNATIAYALSITGGNGTASGLVDSHTGSSDVLVLNGNTIEGHVGTTGGTLAFTITVDPATGIVTFTEDRAVVQADATSPDTGEGISLTAGLVNLVATITDKDGDFQTAHIDLGKQLTITDDGPTLSATIVTGSVDEGDLRSVALLGTDTFGSGNDTGPVTTGGLAGSLNSLVTFGADGPNTTPFQFISGATAALVALGIHSHGALVDTATLSPDGHTLTASTSGIGAHAVFSLLINNDGSWTFTDLGPIDHPIPASDPSPTSGTTVGALTTTAVEDSVTLDLSSLINAVDADGDFVPLSGDLKITVVDDIPVLNSVSTDGVLANAVGSFGGTTDFSVGADGGAHFHLRPLTTVAGLTETWTDNSDGSSTIVGTVTGQATPYFDMTINADGSYVFHLDSTTPVTTVTNHLTFAVTGGPDIDILTASDGSTFDGVLFSNLTDTALDGPENGGSSGALIKPTSSDGFGQGTGSNVGDHGGFVFTPDIPAGGIATGFSFDATNSSSTSQSVIHWAAYTGSVEPGSVANWATLDTLVTTGDVTINGKGVLDTVNINVATGFTFIVVEETTATANGGVRVNNFTDTTTQTVVPPDQHLDFQVSVSDYDHDLVAGSGATQQINVTLLGGDPSVGVTITATADGQALMGTAHVDTLSSGGFTNDFLIGNGGLDILNGGAGIDNFVVALTALDPSNPTANLATINNFTASDKILVDVADVSGNMGASQAINAVTQFQSGAGGPTATSFSEAGGATDKFYYDTTGQNLWYSADGGAHAIEVAHLATGVATPAQVATAVHTF